jgi:hypothetical protein
VIRITNARISRFILYCKRRENVYKVTNVFKNTRFIIAFKTTNKILHQLQSRTNIGASKASGIYRLLCRTCNISYVGQFGRATAVRYKELIRYIRTNTPTSAYDLHVFDQQHEHGCLDETLHLLKTCDKGNLMNLWETFYIQQLHHMDKLIHTTTGNQLTVCTRQCAITGRTVIHQHSVHIPYITR